VRRFVLLASLYSLVCCLVAIAIVLHGDGPRPRIVALYPRSGDRFWPGGIAEITFSQPMDHASVQRALQVSIPGQGQEIWYGNTLNLQPLGNWRPNAIYRIRLVGKVTDTEGRPLRTPVNYWFRVHVVGHLGYCRLRGVRNVCELGSLAGRAITSSPRRVGDYALSPDGTTVAYTSPDPLGVSHLHVIQTDGTGDLTITRGEAYSDSRPFWASGDSTNVSYYRRKVLTLRPFPRLGRAEIWNVNTDGTGNARVAG